MNVKASDRPTENRAWSALVITSGVAAADMPGKTRGMQVTSKTATTSLAKTRRCNATTPTRQETTREPLPTALRSHNQRDYLVPHPPVH
ncbi:hypothetical protein Lesp02_23430 [Lentzea sp. NBRC 105346]|nr:hypothetical protein Lesp02_23430 [Lentzea sp. NBRC 105346]